MNKEELKKHIENIEKELQEAKKKLEQAEGPWRAENGEEYYYIGTKGVIASDIEAEYDSDNKRHPIGNYFKTEEDAKNSFKYHVMNDGEYEYFLPWYHDEDFCPRKKEVQGLEIWSEGKIWSEECSGGGYCCIYRWKRGTRK